MTEPTHQPLEVATIIKIHTAMIDEHGGTHGVKSLEGLESALAQPCESYFGHQRFPTVEEQAGAYLYFIARAHAFHDGNKRTSSAAALLWLWLHDLKSGLSQQELEDLVVKAVEEHYTPKEITEGLKIAPKS